MTRTCLSLEAWPLVIYTSRAATPRARASVRTNSSFAAPSTGGAATRTRRVPACSPATPLREARGTTRTVKRSAPSRSEH